MSQQKSVARTVFTFFLMILVPWTYHALYTLLYGVAYFVYPGMSDWIEGNYYFFDVLFCIFSMTVYLPWFLKLRRSEEELSFEEEERPTFGLSLFFKITVITLGLGGLSQWWLIGVSEFLSEENVLGMGESLQSFNETWNEISTESYLWMILSIGILGPVVEELVFRGIQFSLAKRIRRGWFPILFTSLAFGIWHGEPVQVVYTAITGIGIAIVMEATGTLWIPVYMHILNNVFSSLPPSWETEDFAVTMSLVRLFCVIPAFLFLFRMVRDIHRKSVRHRSPSPAEEIVGEHG